MNDVYKTIANKRKDLHIVLGHKGQGTEAV
jgi:hypothetical protein